MPTDKDIQELVDYTEVLEKLEQLRDLSPPNPGLIPSLPHPCPSCGYCPSCGRRTAPYYDPGYIWTNNTFTIASNG